MDKPAEQIRSERAALGICFLLVLMVWGVFGQTLRHDFVNYDDDWYVYDNPVISKGLTGEGIRMAVTQPHGANWHPLTSLSHMLDVELYGLDPEGHHRTNVLLHMATTVLLFLVLRSMTGSLWRSAFVAAVFAIHPLRVESVAWISERKDVLSGLFFMLTLGAYLRYVRRPFSAGRYAAVAVFLALGLMSKAMLVTVPLVLLLLDFWPLKRWGRHGVSGSTIHDRPSGRLPPDQPSTITRQPLLRLIAEKIPLLLISVTFCGITVWAQHKEITPYVEVSAPWRIGNALCSYLVYIRQMLLPAGLAVLYPHPGTNLPLWRMAVSFILLVTISLPVLLMWKKRPYLLTGWLWYLGMLVPVIGIMQVGGQAHADRYTYLPQIGLTVLLTWLAADLSGEWRHRRIVLSMAAAVLLATLMAGAWIQASYWRDSQTLWTHTLQSVKMDNSGAHNNLGNALVRQGEAEAAIEHFRHALRISPDNAGAHYNLGNALARQGEVEAAIEHYRHALRIRPDYTRAHNNLGTMLARQGEAEASIEHFQHALRITPGYAEAHYNLGNALARQGETDAAIEHFQIALRIRPDDAEAHYYLGLSLQELGETDAAIEHFQLAVRIAPDLAKAHFSLGALSNRKKSYPAAIHHFDQVLQINPDDAEVKDRLAWILATCPDAALRDGKRAVELALSADQLTGGGYALVLDTLAAAYAEAGRYPEAVATARRALDATTDQKAADGIRKRLELYQAGRPYHESEEMNSND